MLKSAKIVSLVGFSVSFIMGFWLNNLGSFIFCFLSAALFASVTYMDLKLRNDEAKKTEENIRAEIEKLTRRISALETKTGFAENPMKMNLTRF